MIEIKNLTKTYVGRRALTDVRLSLPGGEIVGLSARTARGRQR